ncbi:MAG: hypothetical protein ACOX6T_06905 [Myxococcales bacterium]|jgi:hypothetical protein
MRTLRSACFVLALLFALPAQAQGFLTEEDFEEVVEEGEAPEPEAAELPAAESFEQAHAARRRDHVLEVVKVESAIESLNDGTVQVFGLRRAYRCPTGELVSESACNPCVRRASEWGSRPHGVWIYEAVWRAGDERSRAAAIERLEHFRKYFELEHRGGAEAGSRVFGFHELTGRTRAPAEAAKAERVRFFVGGAEATAAVVPAAARFIELEARAQTRGANGSLVEYPEARIELTSACGELKEAGPGKALFTLKPMVARCEVKATATPGGATAVIGVRRAVEVEITYEGQAADKMLLEGAESVVLGYRASAGGEEMEIQPEWKARGGALEILDGGRSVRFRLEKGGSGGEVQLLDLANGAGDTLVLERKRPE